MADYLPVYKPGRDITSTTSGAVTGGQLLAVSGNGTVATAGASSSSWIGVAAFDAASGARVTIHVGGVQRLTASGSITAGDQVVCAASGQVSTLAAAGTATAGDINNARAVVGIALTTATNGNTVDVAMAR